MPDKTAATSAAAYVSGGGLTVFGVIQLDQLAVLVGIICALATLLVNTHYQRRRDKREQELHAEQISLAKRSTGRRAPPEPLDF